MTSQFLPGDDGNSLLVALIVGCVLIPGLGIAGAYLFSGPDQAELAFRLTVALVLPTLLMVALLFAAGVYSGSSDDER
ncbi:hypothetical protein [Natronobacterium texcoconense]|uniref:Uncharacterized protein n=1 Tax=Natronobacterium texcoconense TaxID=1095778 RepID=A0A1H1GUV9_NATTX|nr:hypothetical protein [Natronobacterium texcoconense]SDR16698.1 hypothetical protein SAMN04489842_2612 [Natronobacterium texcoconense]